MSFGAPRHAFYALAAARATRELLVQHCEAAGTFQGELGRKPADTWIASLLEQPMALRMGGAGGEPTLVDPRSVVEEILEWRGAVAEDWIRRLEAVPDELLEIKREHLESRAR